MSTQNPINNPTAYMGLRETYVGQVYFRNRDPRTRTAQDDYKGYYEGDRWINTVAESSWVLVKKIYDHPTHTKQAVWIGFSGGAGDMETLTPDAGGAVSPTSNNIKVFGTAAQGVSTSNAGASTLQITVADATTASKGVAKYDPVYFSIAAGAVTLIASPATQFWVAAPGAAQAMTANYGYYATVGGAGCSFTLPVACAVGSRISIVGVGTQWTVAQGAGQTVIMGAGIASTIGAGGSLASTDGYDCIHLLCTTANTTFVRIGVGGNITVV
jgi:hypothetical protein